MKTRITLQQRREQMGLRVMDMCKRANISRAAYYTYEYGKRNPDVVTALKLGDILGVKDLRELWATTAT